MPVNKTCFFIENMVEFIEKICHGRRSNPEFQILPVESPIGVSTNTNLVESTIGVSTGRKSNLGDIGIALGSEI